VVGLYAVAEDSEEEEEEEEEGSEEEEISNRLRSETKV
jgi:hypothetical protein